MELGNLIIETWVIPNRLKEDFIIFLKHEYRLEDITLTVNYGVSRNWNIRLYSFSSKLPKFLN